VHLVDIIKKKFVTMHGHMNVKKKAAFCVYGYCVIRRSLSRPIHRTFGWENT